MELSQLVEYVKKLSKARELADLQARTNCLFMENSELKIWIVFQESELQEIRALKIATDAKLVHAREDQDRAEAISHKFYEFVEHPRDVINKAQLYGEGLSQQGTPM